MDVLVAAVRRTRNQYSWMAVPVTGLGLGMLVGGTAAGEPMTTRVLCGVFGALFAAFGLAIGRLAYTMRNPERAPVVTLVKERPQEVAWIYVQQIDSQAAGVSVRKTHNVKAATFARSAGGKPEYQQVYSSALYGRDAIKDFDDYIRTSHRAAAEHGQDPLTRVNPDRPLFMLVEVTEACDGWQVGWPAQGKTTTGEDVAHSYHQIQRQNNEKALGELDHWADLHDDATQKWLERWQRRQHDDLAA